MSQLLIAQRYAKALMQIGIKQNNAAELQRELEAVVGLVKTQPDLERLCMYPLIAPGRKAAVFDEILQKVNASDTIRRFFTVVAGAARLNLIHELSSSFNDLFDKHQGVLPAEITCAHPLTDAQLLTLQITFAKRVGKKMRFTTRQDSGLLGGLKIRVGSTIYDASLQCRLRLLKERLLSA